MTAVKMPSCSWQEGEHKWHGVSERGITRAGGELGITPGKKDKVTFAVRSQIRITAEKCMNS
jgi:hypothetical protein